MSSEKPEVLSSSPGSPLSPSPSPLADPSAPPTSPHQPSPDTAADNSSKTRLQDEDEAGAASVEMVVCWHGKSHPLQVFGGMTVADLKDAVHQETNVRPPNQKLFNIVAKGGKPVTDDTRLQDLKVFKNKMKVMLMGSTDDEIADMTEPVDVPDVLNDLSDDSVLMEAVDRQQNQAKLERRIAQTSIRLRSASRPGKKLLVLDIDYTLFDHRSVGQNGDELMRPYLHEFLASSYEHYDIAIWSATSMKWIDEKMRLLRVHGNPHYQVAFQLDSRYMIRIHTKDYGHADVKPLGVVWAKLPQYSAGNTIMFDDLRRNFLMNPQNGLKIRPYMHCHQHRHTDRELLRLAAYLRDIAALPDLSHLKHKHWEKYRKGGY